MLATIQSEFLKVKHSKVFLLTMLGGLISPLLMLMGIMIDSGLITKFSDLFDSVNQYSLLLTGLLVFGLLISYLFIREYEEHTIKTVITIPVSRTKFLIGKFATFTICMILISLITFAGTLFMGVFLGFKGLTLNILLTGLYQYLIGGLLLSLSLSPVVLAAVMFKHLVPTVICTIVIALSNVLAFSNNYIALSPWASPYFLVLGTIEQFGYGTVLPILMIVGTFLVGFLLNWIYFTQRDIGL